MRRCVFSCLVLLLASSMLFSACSRKRGPSPYAEMMNGYIGEHIEELIEKLGVPNGRYISGNKGIYEWRDANIRSNYIGGTSQYVVYCDTKVVTDEDDIIVSWTAKGNGCY